MKEQGLLFDDGGVNDWRKEWIGMPEFTQEEKEPYQTIIIRFECQADVNSFSNLIGQKITDKTKSIWHPFKSHWGNGSNYVWRNENDCK